MGESILVAISNIVAEKLGLKEALKKTGEEALKAFVWAPLTEVVKRFFTSEQETKEFVKKISTKEANNIRKPYRDVEDVYEEMSGKESSEELYSAIEDFFKNNQKAVSDANLQRGQDVTYIGGTINNNDKGVVNVSYGPQINTLNFH